MSVEEYGSFSGEFLSTGSGMWTTTTDSTAIDPHNHTVYMDDYSKVKPADQWYVYGDGGNERTTELIGIISALWKTLKPYIARHNSDDAIEIDDMVNAVKAKNGHGIHYGTSSEEEKPEHLKDLEDLFEI